MAQAVEHILGKDEVTSSSLVSSSTKKHDVGRVFFNVCKVFCTHLHNFFEIVRGACRLRSAIENTSCSHRLLLPSELSRQTSRRYGVPFLCASRTPLQKLCRRVRRLRSRLPLASNFSLFTCRHQLYGLFCHRSLSAAVLFVWFFNLKISWIFL